MDPVHGVRVAALTDNRETFERAHIVFLHPFTIVIHLLDDTHTGRCHVQAVHFVILDPLPESSWVGCDRFAFIED